MFMSLLCSAWSLGHTHTQEHAPTFSNPVAYMQTFNLHLLAILLILGLLHIASTYVYLALHCFYPQESITLVDIYDEPN